jgi:hypothetical protein
MPAGYVPGCKRARRRAASPLNARPSGRPPGSALDWKPVSDSINIDAREADVGEFTVGHENELTRSAPALMSNAKIRKRSIDFTHNHG